MDNADGSYVHEGFLADWRPGTSKLISSERPCSNIRDKNLPNDMSTEEGAHVREHSNSYMSVVIQPLPGHMQGISTCVEPFPAPLLLFSLCPSCP